MVDKNAEAGDSQASDAEAKITVFAQDEPPKEEWATYEGRRKIYEMGHKRKSKS